MKGYNTMYEKKYEYEHLLPQSPRWAQQPAYNRLRTYGSTRARAARLPVIIASFIFSAIMFVLFTGATPATSPSLVPQTSPGNVHLLIPASAKDENLCKAVVGAAILGYPSPKVLNWGKTFNDEHLVSGGSHIAKISGVSSYLESLLPEQDEDLVIMTDGYDTWFQLRPETLIQRYFDINKRANERIRRELGHHVATTNKIEQKIVFSAQKRCWPWAADAPPCYAVPESTLPEHVFGSNTDTDVGDRNPYLKFRPRYLNSGVVVGTAGAMRQLFTEALIRANEDPNFGSDQNIFGSIFGDQEVYREVVRQRDMGWIERQHNLRSDDPRRGLVREDDLEAVRNLTRSMEFGIGLDYEGSISLPTVFSEDDTEWVNFDNQPWLDFFNYKRGIDKSDSKLILAQDIVKTAVPLYSNGTDGIEVRNWSQVPLFTNIPTGHTPAIIHHNAHRDGMKSLRRSVWDKIWFQPYARVLLDQYMDTPLTTLAVAGGREWRSSDEWKGGVRNDVDGWLPYQDICGGTETEIFRDGKGPWTASRHA
ncbi:hypothetical protein E4T42_09189 [Aureobasidium subglaciale]|nr:hypothetical protein E4T42_09189 [Aureobasidium subglaciale]